MEITAATLILLEILVVVVLVCGFLIFILRQKNKTVLLLSQQLIQKKKALKKKNKTTSVSTENTTAPSSGGGKTYPEYIDDAITGTEFHFKNTSGQKSIKLNPKDHINQQAIALRHMFLQTEKNACLDEGLFSWQAIEEGLAKIGKAYLGESDNSTDSESNEKPLEATSETAPAPTEEGDLESLTDLVDNNETVPELQNEINHFEAESAASEDDPTNALLDEMSGMEDGLEDLAESKTETTAENPEEVLADDIVVEDTEQTAPIEPSKEVAEDIETPEEVDPMADLLDAFGPTSNASTDVSDLEIDPIESQTEMGIPENSIDLSTPENEIAELEKALFDTPLEDGLEDALADATEVESEPADDVDSPIDTPIEAPSDIPMDISDDAELPSDSELDILVEDNATIEDIDTELDALEQALSESDAPEEPEADSSADTNLSTEADTSAEAQTEENNKPDDISAMSPDDIDAVLDSADEVIEQNISENKTTESLPDEFDLATEELAEPLADIDSIDDLLEDVQADELPAEDSVEPETLADIDSIDALLEDVQTEELPTEDSVEPETLADIDSIDALLEDVQADELPTEYSVEPETLADIDSIEDLLEEVQEGELPSLEERIKSEEPEPLLDDEQAELLADLLEEKEKHDKE